MKVAILGLSIFVSLFLLSGCFSTNTRTTTTHLKPDGVTIDKIVIEEELSDDALYYQEAGKAIVGKRANSSTVTDPTAQTAIAALDTIQALSGKRFVDRGMNGYEMTRELGGDVVKQTPAIAMGVGLYKLADTPSSIEINGDGNRYDPNEYHWTGNGLEEGSSITAPYTDASPYYAAPETGE